MVIRGLGNTGGWLVGVIKRKGGNGGVVVQSDNAGVRKRRGFDRGGMRNVEVFDLGRIKMLHDWVGLVTEN